VLVLVLELMRGIEDEGRERRRGREIDFAGAFRAFVYLPSAGRSGTIV
jgi:hypothetical protein